MIDMQKHQVAVHPSGKTVWEIHLRNARGTEIVVSNYGAIIKNFWVAKPGGGHTDIILGFDKMEDYWSPTYLQHYAAMGCVIGRVANRIRDARFTVDGEAFSVSRNLGPHHLHGGFEGFGKKVWEMGESGTAPCPYAVFHYQSADGEEGYPGELQASIRFELNEQNELSYAITGTATKATPVNFTHHGYFNLSEQATDVREQYLQVAADSVLKQDQELLPIGVLNEVEGTPYDFRESRRIGDALMELNEIDTSFVLTGEKEKPAARLSDPGTGLTLDVFTTEPVAHVYTGNWSHQIMGKQGKAYGAFCGICLETQVHPNAINIPSFPSTILRPGEVYHHRTAYRAGYPSLEK